MRRAWVLALAAGAVACGGSEDPAPRAAAATPAATAPALTATATATAAAPTATATATPEATATAAAPTATATPKATATPAPSATKAPAKPKKASAPIACLTEAGLTEAKKGGDGLWGATDEKSGQPIAVDGPYTSMSEAQASVKSLEAVSDAAIGGRYVVSASLGANAKATVDKVAGCLSARGST